MVRLESGSAFLPDLTVPNYPLLTGLQRQACFPFLKGTHSSVPWGPLVSSSLGLESSSHRVLLVP